MKEHTLRRAPRFHHRGTGKRGQGSIQAKMVSFHPTRQVLCYLMNRWSACRPQSSLERRGFALQAAEYKWSVDARSWGGLSFVQSCPASNLCQLLRELRESLALRQRVHWCSGWTWARWEGKGPWAWAGYYRHCGWRLRTWAVQPYMLNFVRNFITVMSDKSKPDVQSGKPAIQPIKQPTTKQP